MRRSRTAQWLAASIAIVALSACRNEEHGFGNGRVAGTVADSTPITLGAGDVMITNSDSSIDLALAGDKVIMKLTDKLVAKIKNDLDTAKVDTSSKFGAMIAKKVKTGVASAINRRVECSLADISAVRYADDHIELDTSHSDCAAINHIQANDKKALASFRPDDAKRFVAAVQARMASRSHS